MENFQLLLPFILLTANISEVNNYHSSNIYLRLYHRYSVLRETLVTQISKVKASFLSLVLFILYVTLKMFFLFNVQDKENTHAQDLHVGMGTAGC